MKAKKIRDGLANLKEFPTGFGNINYDDKDEFYPLKFVIKQMQPDDTAKIVQQ